MKILAYEQIWDEAALEAGEADQAELVETIEPDNIGDAIRELRNAGVDPSSSYFCDGMWYTSSETDIFTGDVIERSYFLEGATAAQAEHIYNGLFGRHAQRARRAA